MLVLPKWSQEDGGSGSSSVSSSRRAVSSSISPILSGGAAAAASFRAAPASISVVRAASSRRVPAAGDDALLAAAEMNLAPGWTPKWSTSRGEYYWRNDETGATVTTKPALDVEAAAAAQEQPTVNDAGILVHGVASAAGKANAEIGLPPGWAAVWSAADKAWYWTNKDSGESTWTKPTRHQRQASTRASAASAEAAASADGGASTDEAPAPDGWERIWSDENQAHYFLNSTTKETTWTRPT